MAKIHGRATIYVNGQVFDTDPGATLRVGGLKNNDRSTDQRFHYNQSFIPAQVVCKVPVSVATSLRSLQELAEAEIQFLSDTGRRYVITEAAQTGEVELAGGADGGKVELTFNGQPAEEMI